MHSLEMSSGKATAVHLVECARAIECNRLEGGWRSRHELKYCPRAGCGFKRACGSRGADGAIEPMHSLETRFARVYGLISTSVYTSSAAADSRDGLLRH